MNILRPLAAVITLVVMHYVSAAFSVADDVKIRPVKNHDRTVTRYEFTAGKLTGMLATDKHHHGITRLVHSDNGRDVVHTNQCLLNAEYYMSSNSPAHIAAWEKTGKPAAGYLARAVPRRTSEKGLTTSRVDGNRITIHFPDTLCHDDLKIELDLVYEFHADQRIDMSYRVLAKVDVADFEIFTASYILDWLDQTYVPYKAADKVVWDVFGKGESVGATDYQCYHFARDEAAAKLLTDGRHHYNRFKPWRRPNFVMPIIAAANDDGDVLAFFVDPSTCSNIGGQHHKHDTARDWAVGTNLKKGQTWTTHSRMIYRRLAGNEQKRLAKLESEYQRFVADFPNR